MYCTDAPASQHQAGAPVAIRRTSNEHEQTWRREQAEPQPLDAAFKHFDPSAAHRAAYDGTPAERRRGNGCGTLFMKDVITWARCNWECVATIRVKEAHRALHQAFTLQFACAFLYISLFDFWSQRSANPGKKKRSDVMKSLKITTSFF